MARCSFCEFPIKQGTGKIFVKTDGKVLSFCSGKCEKNMLVLKRKALNCQWTRKYLKSRGGKK